MFVLNILSRYLLGTNLPEVWVRNVWAWVRIVRIRNIHGYETTGYHRRRCKCCLFIRCLKPPSPLCTVVKQKKFARKHSNLIIIIYHTIQTKTSTTIQWLGARFFYPKFWNENDQNVKCARFSMLHSYSGMDRTPFQPFCSQGQNEQNVVNENPRWRMARWALRIQTLLYRSTGEKVRQASLSAFQMYFGTGESSLWRQVVDMLEQYRLHSPWFEACVSSLLYTISYCIQSPYFLSLLYLQGKLLW